MYTLSKFVLGFFIIVIMFNIIYKNCLFHKWNYGLFQTKICNIA